MYVVTLALSLITEPYQFPFYLKWSDFEAKIPVGLSAPFEKSLSICEGQWGIMKSVLVGKMSVLIQAEPLTCCMMVGRSLSILYHLIT